MNKSTFWRQLSPPQEFGDLTAGSCCHRPAVRDGAVQRFEGVERPWPAGDSNRARSGRFRPGFTLVELAVLVGLLGFLALAAVPVLSKTTPNSKSVQCLSNTRAIIAAWQMYAQDYNDRMVITLHGAAASGGAGDPVWGVGWASGWLDWSTSPDNTNVLLLVHERYAKLAKYINQARTYQCPSDNSLSPVQIVRSWTHRSRSYAGNIYIGEGNAESGPSDTIYKHVKRTTEFQYPTPAEAWVFLEEHPDSINDPGFFSPHQTTWIDVPSPFHNGATPFAFADGHAEMRRWERSLMSSWVSTIHFNWPGNVAAPVGDPDIHWLSYHTPRNSSASY